MDKFDLILHPLRMRILLTLAGQQMSAQQLASALPDVAQATLYRHINALAEGGLLSVVEERPVRGTVEKVYTMDNQAALIGAEEAAAMSKDDHLRAFTAFTALLLSEFQRYLDSTDTPDAAADGVGYHQRMLYISDEEMLDFGKALYGVLKHYESPGPGRKRRLFSTVMMPDLPGH